MEKIYRNDHHFNPYTLIHHYSDDGSIIRKWEAESRIEAYSHYEDGKLVKNTKSTSPEKLAKSVFKTDGSESLEKIVDDIMLCFCFTGASFGSNDHDIELHRAIYETKLPADTVVCQYDTGRVCQGVIEMLETSTEVEGRPKNYYELFEIIGIPYEYGDVQYADKYVIWQYPDSVMLSLKATDNKLFFGYGR